MGAFSYYYFGQALQVLVTGNLNEASGVTGFVLLRLGHVTITINEVVTVLVAMSAYSTIPVCPPTLICSAQIICIFVCNRGVPYLNGTFFCRQLVPAGFCIGCFAYKFHN